jgi:hypothetical protein
VAKIHFWPVGNPAQPGSVVHLERGDRIILEFGRDGSDGRFEFVVGEKEATAGIATDLWRIPMWDQLGPRVAREISARSPRLMATYEWRTALTVEPKQAGDDQPWPITLRYERDGRALARPPVVVDVLQQSSPRRRYALDLDRVPREVEFTGGVARRARLKPSFLLDEAGHEHPNLHVRGWVYDDGEKPVQYLLRLGNDTMWRKPAPADVNLDLAWADASGRAIAIAESENVKNARVYAGAAPSLTEGEVITVPDLELLTRADVGLYPYNRRSGGFMDARGEWARHRAKGLGTFGAYPTTVLRYGVAGGRWEYGPLPGWAARLFARRDPQLGPLIVALNRQAGTNTDDHYFDESTGRMADWRGRLRSHVFSKQFQGPMIERAESAVPYEAKASAGHYPDLSHAWWLITGDPRATEVAHNTAGYIWSIYPPVGRFRDGRANADLVNGVRNFEGMFRAAAYAFLQSPEGSRDRDYWRRHCVELADNLYANAARHPPGMVLQIESVEGIAAWMNDRAFVQVALLYHHLPEAKRLVDKMSEWSVRRFDPVHGEMLRFASAYGHAIRRPDKSLVTSVAEMYRVMASQHGTKDLIAAEEVHGAIGANANALGMLGAAAHRGIPGAREAHAWLSARLPKTLGDFPSLPQWDIGYLQ